MKLAILGREKSKNEKYPKHELDNNMESRERNSMCEESR